MHRLIATVFAPLAFVPAAWAQFAYPGGSTASEASMVSEVKSIAAGAKFSVALKLEHPEGWHSYYQNSGGVEQAPDHFACVAVQFGRYTGTTGKSKRHNSLKIMEPANGLEPLTC